MGLESIYSFMIKRMMAVADEIFDSVKDSIIEYEKEIERLKQENCSLRSRNCSCAETCHGLYHIHYYKPIINKNCIPSIITFLKRGIQCIRLTISYLGSHIPIEKKVTLYTNKNYHGFTMFGHEKW